MQTAFGENEVLIWFDDDCERRRLIYIDEIQPDISLPKWRRRTFINALSSVKKPSVGCKEIYKSAARITGASRLMSRPLRIPMTIPAIRPDKIRTGR